MTERDTSRLIAWSNELRNVHARLRQALQVVRDAVDDGVVPGGLSADLLLYCHGFCVALGQHHRGEDRSLFPAIEAAHPELAPVLRNLEQDHSMIEYLIIELDATTRRPVGTAELERHLDGLSAIMESHFGYEERQLLGVLETLELRADPATVLGGL